MVLSKYLPNLLDLAKFCAKAFVKMKLFQNLEEFFYSDENLFDAKH